MQKKKEQKKDSVEIHFSFPYITTPCRKTKTDRRHCDVVNASCFKNVVEKYPKIETWKTTSVRSSPDYSLRRV